MALIARRRFVLSGLAALASSAALAACAPAAPVTLTAAPKPTEVPRPPTTVPGPVGPESPAPAPAPTTASAPTAAPAAAPQPTTGAQAKLSLALVPSENAQEQARQWGDFFKWLEKRLDVRIENFVATDYTAVIEAMRARRFADAMQAVGNEAPDLLKAGGYAKFVPVADADYDVIRETAKALHLDVKKLK